MDVPPLWDVTSQLSKVGEALHKMLIIQVRLLRRVSHLGHTVLHPSAPAMWFILIAVSIGSFDWNN